MKTEQLENIHNNLVNGNRRDCVKQIKKYGLYDFWPDYLDYINERHLNIGFFTDMTISYFRITNR